MMKEAIKKLLKSSRLGKFIYPFVQTIYRFYCIPRKRKLLQKNGLVILKTLDNIFNDIGEEYYVDFGTLLGIIRENGFIKSDDDIDVTICNPDIDPHMLVRIFLEKGFKFIHSLEYHERPRIVSMRHLGTSIDFYFRELSDDRSEYWMYGIYFDPNLNYPGPEWNSCRRGSYPVDLKSERFIFRGIQISIPNNAEEHLVFEYGGNWRIPDSKFKGNPEKKLLVMPDYAKRVISVDDFLKG